MSKTLAVFPVVLALLLIWACDDSPTDSPEPTDDYLRVPSQYLTIQQAIDASEDGDTVLVADGLYRGSGNRDIVFNGKQITLCSENGPLATIIDCEGTDSTQHFGFNFVRRENSAVLDGFTIRNGHFNNGAGIYTQSCSPEIKNCILINNHAPVSGGAIRCKGTSSPRIVNCTMVGNSSMAGGGLLVIAGASPVLENCIIAFSPAGEGVYSVDGSSIPSLSCCLIYGNAGGDWIGRISDQMAINGNLHIDPQFCDTAALDLRLQPGSPCLPENNACDAPIGTLPAGCD